MQNVYVVLYFSDQTVLYLLVVILAQSAVLLNHIMKLQLCMVCVKGSLFLYQFSKNTSEDFCSASIHKKIILPCVVL